MDSNTICVKNNFISSKICENILNELKDSEWVESQIVETKKEGFTESVSQSRKCFNYYSLPDYTVDKIKDIENKLSESYGVKIKNLEEWQICRYFEGGYYNFHLDCGCWANSPSGERQKTIMIYLESPLEGGDTYFRALNKKIKAKSGKLLLWNNLLPNGKCNHAMIHAGLPVNEGVKTILVTWERQKKFIH
jgi:prolyl 4-hydroxylase